MDLRVGDHYTQVRVQGEFLLCFSKWHSTKALKGENYIDRGRQEFKQKCRGEKV